MLRQVEYAKDSKVENTAETGAFVRDTVVRLGPSPVGESAAALDFIRYSREHIIHCSQN